MENSYKECDKQKEGLFMKKLLALLLVAMLLLSSCGTKPEKPARPGQAFCRGSGKSYAGGACASGGQL